MTKLSFARKLRQNGTDAERRLWHHLRNRNLNGWKFRRQVPIGLFVADFMCKEARLIVEIDGSQHADDLARDGARTAHLNELGYSVIRFWNADVLTATDAVLETILAELNRKTGIER
ncbi:endonuclease domain-containing protein [Roseibium suaedae]|uniref:Very-short-patch-repair endonuclease n=1 Tax=Roseibium suaedae TaxID=735517 RepID=A0A1M7CWP3_9HYPH|nr:endonuclease domain-containing protein [Roseibium suaedae]SHL71758.1 Very-short-patch-repair endonuclease [Roseibium suaedae]